MNRLEVKKFLDLLHPNGELFEVRSINGRYINSGYFTNIDTAIEEMEKYPRATFYVTLNKINSGCYSREQHDTILAINDKQKKTTGDNDIVEINNILIDFDPKRISGVSATDEEKKLAEVKMRTAYRYLRNNGFEDMIVVDSGNGYHLLVRVSIAPKDNDVVKDFLLSLSAMFSDDKVDIDTSNFNPSRITKIAGVMTSKGANTPDRPHRESKIIYIPPEIKKTDFPYIQKIASFVQQEVESPSYRNNYQRFNIRDFIQKHGIPIQSEQNTGGITKFILKECPFNNSHKAPDSAIFQMPSGAIGFKCFHNSCSDKTWKDIRGFYEPDWIDRKRQAQTATPNYKATSYQPVSMPNLDVDNPPDFYTLPQIAALPNQERKLIPTGYKELDKKLGGLAKGEVSVLSARNGAGKSTLLTQICLNMIDTGYRVALFTGELTAQRARNWTCRIAAGKQYSVKSKYGDGYYITDETRQKIDAWANNKLFIYNNNNGNNFNRLCEKLNKCVVENKVDFVAIDNLASIDISALSPSEFEAQRIFINKIVAFAQANDIHVLLILHPRKEMGVINKYSISGSADLSNRVDVCVLLHRVTEEFKRTVQAEYRWKSDNPLLNADSLIEITKDRENGTVDYFIPLYYEPESHRLNETRYESKVYGWKKSDIYDELPM